MSRFDPVYHAQIKREFTAQVFREAAQLPELAVSADTLRRYAQLVLDHRLPPPSMPCCREEAWDSLATSMAAGIPPVSMPAPEGEDGVPIRPTPPAEDGC